ncbi:hypothetical protein L202_06657 [Cryptococcus amylolentus CBS 6039]|uniref:Phosphatidic acid phosphatase type 2/haloperoxidase domain-containing protein n=2 Tax=Cryptococcus amylolentus TaxID=104669 RepID=A0A1E3HGQ9_9TREE|nr:hypothetical protein L202_06657 [Cryptococcus amylolentus CBS 6039]ODN75532.1 hypothetical protein L202_06657 [Cryptococcus amylolentus CBS 6039]ODO03238.1 hypothetical protein I350_06083 [Cryptococcus amylolentus CBS 6273]
MLHPHSPSEYPSILLYVLDETHITVTAATALTILFTRDAHVVWLALGALSSSLSAKVLKKMIRQPRPPPPPSSSKPSKIRPKKTYGFPSTHSSALSFYFFYLLPLFSCLPTSSSIPLSAEVQRWGAGAAVTSYWAAGLWSRKELGYHTWEQILAGAAWGGVVAWAWGVVWEKFALQGPVQGLIDGIWGATVGRLI